MRGDKSQARTTASVAEESVRRHFKGINEVALCLFTAFSLGVKGTRD